MASNLKVIIDNAQTKIKIPSGTRMLVRRSCHAVLMYEGYDRQTEIYVVFTDNETMQQYHELRVSSYEAEEVIAVPEKSGDHLGKLIISVERILELGAVYNQPFEMGVVYASAHGAFNLLGEYYSDAMSKEALMLKEAAVMTQLGFSPLADFSDFEV